MIKSHETVRLKKNLGVMSGEKTFTESKIEVIKTCEVKKKGTEIESGGGYTTYLVFGGMILPEPGDIIVTSAGEYEIKETLECRDISGDLRGIKCITLN